MMSHRVMSAPRLSVSHFVLILLRCVCRFLLVQVKRYTVQTAVTEKLRSLLRVPITLSVKNCVADNVVMPVPWLPQRYVLLPFTPTRCVCNRPHIRLV
jgi:hypothetical protein